MDAQNGFSGHWNDFSSVRNFIELQIMAGMWCLFLEKLIWILTNIISVNDWLAESHSSEPVWQRSTLMVNIMSNLFLITWGTAYWDFLISYKPSTFKYCIATKQ